jgi:hypothetical protein
MVTETPDRKDFVLQLSPIFEINTSAPSVFAIDPGVSTGWAYISPFDCEVGTILINAATGGSYKEVLAKLLDEFRPEKVVIERMPTYTPWMPIASKIADQCKQVVVEYLRSNWDNFFLIGPGEWKPVTGKEELPFKMKTQHEKDAYRMGRYFLYKFGHVKRPTE